MRNWHVELGNFHLPPERLLRKRDVNIISASRVLFLRNMLWMDDWWKSRLNHQCGARSWDMCGNLFDAHCEVTWCYVPYIAVELKGKATYWNWLDSSVYSIGIWFFELTLLRAMPSAKIPPRLSSLGLVSLLDLDSMPVKVEHIVNTSRCI